MSPCILTFGWETMSDSILGMLLFAGLRVNCFAQGKKVQEEASRVDMRHIFGPNSHVLIAILVGLLLAMAMDIWDREFGPFRPGVAFFAILGHVRNTISPWGQGPSQNTEMTLVAYDQGSIVLGFGICPCGAARGMQFTVLATSPTFGFFAVFCAIV